MFLLGPRLRSSECFYSWSLVVLSISAVHLELLTVSERPGLNKCSLSLQFDKIISYHIIVPHRTDSTRARVITSHRTDSTLARVIT
jgi:hypothetical protein